MALLRYNWQTINCTYLSVNFDKSCHMYTPMKTSPQSTLEVSSGSFGIPPSCPPNSRQTLVYFLSLHISLHLLEFYINRAIQCVLFFSLGLAFFTQHNYFEILPNVTCIKSSFYFMLNSIPLYSYTAICYPFTC